MNAGAYTHYSRRHSRRHRGGAPALRRGYYDPMSTHARNSATSRSSARLRRVNRRLRQAELPARVDARHSLSSVKRRKHMKRDELRACLAEKPYDAMVLTREISRRYATGFHSTAGAVYLSAKHGRFLHGLPLCRGCARGHLGFRGARDQAGQSYSSLING